MSEQPHVLLVDDDPASVQQLLSPVRDDLTFEIREPDEVVVTDLQRADLVVVDHFLDDWLSGYQAEPSKVPRHGIALAGTLQSYVDGLDQQSGALPQGTPTAFALASAHLSLIGGRLPDDVREHAIARLHNLEWAFDKGDREALPSQVLELARAVRAVPSALRDQGADRGRSALHQLLAVPSEAPWAREARSDIFKCHPPILELAELSKGLAVIRWLLHRVIPYPTFLLNDYEVAARLGVSRRSLETMAGPDGLLADVSYEGALATFGGTRWWRAGVEQVIWDITNGRRQPLLQALEEASRGSVEPLHLANPVVVLDVEYRAVSLVAADQAVRVQPDDWPSFADDAWMTIEQVLDNPGLEGLVLDEDRGRLENGS